MPVHTINKFNLLTALIDFNWKVILVGGVATLAPDADEFGNALDGHWTPLGDGAIRFGWAAYTASSVTEIANILRINALGPVNWSQGIRRDVAGGYLDADVMTYFSKTDSADTDNARWSLIEFALWKDNNNCVFIRYWPTHHPNNHVVQVGKFIGGIQTILYQSGTFGVRPVMWFRIKRVAGTNTYTFYQAVTDPIISPPNWQVMWTGVIADFLFSDLLMPLTFALCPNTISINPEIDWFRQRTDDGIPAQRFWPDLPYIHVIDNALVEWAFDATLGKTWTLTGASCVKNQTVLFKLGVSNSGNDIDVVWIDGAWQTILQVAANAAAGLYDGTRYIHIKAQFVSDGTVQSSLTSFSIIGDTVSPFTLLTPPVDIVISDIPVPLIIKPKTIDIVVRDNDPINVSIGGE